MDINTAYWYKLSLFCRYTLNFDMHEALWFLGRSGDNK